MPADIAQAGSAEQGIRDRVKQNVGVGMAEQATLEGDVHPADDELPARHQCMDVETLPDAHYATFPSINILSARTRSDG